VAPHERLQQAKFALQGVEAASILFIHGPSTCSEMIKNAFCSSLSQALAPFIPLHRNRVAWCFSWR
jgi:hypothetical protein